MSMRADADLLDGLLELMRDDRHVHLYPPGSHPGHPLKYRVVVEDGALPPYRRVHEHHSARDTMSLAIAVDQAEMVLTKRRGAKSSLQRAVADVERVLSAAQAFFGSVDRALIWFRDEPIAEFKSLTPMAMVERGKARAVLDYIETIGGGRAK